MNDRDITCEDHDEIYDRYVGSPILASYRFRLSDDGQSAEVDLTPDYDSANGIWTLAEARVRHDLTWRQVAALASRMRAAAKRVEEAAG